MAVPAALPHDLIPVPTAGRVFVGAGAIRLGDVDPAGRARLDAIVRHLQDIARDDARDAGLSRAETDAWIVRRTAVSVREPLRFDERYEARTFCAGLGSRWAERRTDLVGEHGGHVEAASLWIFVDPSTGTPARLTDAFHDTWAQAADGRKVSARRVLADPADGNLRWQPWAVRRADLDVLDHVNNAAYWEVLVEAAHAAGLDGGPVHAVVEHVAEIGGRDDVVTWASAADARGGLVDVWLRAGGTVRAAGRVSLAPAPAG